MPRIVFIGAGSFGFTRGLVRDLLTFPILDGSTIALVDINKERLDWARRATETFIQRTGSRCKVEASTDRAAVLKGADAVLSTIRATPFDIWRLDTEIPMKYGVSMNIGDTRSVGGVFRALREIPVMLGIARDLERYCPRALFLNYTNPMAMNCRAIQKTTKLQVTGLCHSVQGTAEMLAKWIGADMKDVTYVSAGINHQAFYTEFKVKGKDANPLIRKVLTTQPKIYQQEIVRNEMFLALGYYVTESSGHASEYSWWFRKDAGGIKKYCLPGTGWNPGVHAYHVDEFRKREKTWKKSVDDWFAQGAQFPMQRGHEYAACIINAFLGGEMYKFHGNVPNRGLIDNLPPNVCVEVPVVVDRRGLNCIHVGPLPPQLAALVNASVAVEEMAVEACLTGDPTMVYHALCYDPLCAAVLDLRQIKKMTQEMLRKNRAYLPTFKKGVEIGG